MTAPTTPDTASGGVSPPGEPAGPTRKRMALWDRVRLLFLFTAAWLVIVWASMADNPPLAFVDAVRIQVVESQWLLWLTGVELVRQAHFLVSEHWSGYHVFWSQRVFGGVDR